VKREVRFKSKHNFTKKIEGNTHNLKKEIKQEFKAIKPLFFIILVLSSIQVLLSILGYFPILEKINLSDKILIFETTEFTIFSLISTIKVGMLFIAGFAFTLKNKFGIRKIAIISLILLVSALPSFLFTERFFSGLPSLLKILNFSIITLMNFIVYFLLCALGSLFGEAYKKLKKQI
jgi:hypothetical protein